MAPTRLILQAPGKLMVAGEYAVLEPHAPSVVVAVDRFIQADIALAPENKLTLSNFKLEDIAFRLQDGQLCFESSDTRLRFVGEALGVSLLYLREMGRPIRPFHITLKSRLEDASGRKFGLGGSAAAVVVTVAAVLNLLGATLGIPPAQKLIFKLAAIAHLRAQGSGSGADVAASTYGGWLGYTSYHAEWLQARLKTPESLSALLDSPWPFLSVVPISPVPRGLCLQVGWTGEPVSTAELIKRVRALRANFPGAYGHFLEESRLAVRHLVAGLESANPGRALAGLERNRQALQALGETAGVEIETPALKELHCLAERYGGGGKPSGAGGGDCGIALMFDDERLEALQAAWKAAKLEPLPLQVSDAGVQVLHLEG
jgi:phosphomevalonate kinase